MSVSATQPDWQREAPRRGWDPSRRLLRAIRRYQKGGWLVRRLAVLQHRFWSVVTGADIPLNTQISGGLKLPHPNGVVIHPQSVIGPNCMIFQQVTLGANRGQKGAPQIGGHVDIGPGARILGPVRIGDHAVIGANAVVLKDVPAGCVAVGVPARILTAEETG
ncbi:MAG: serine O-acetyltransferase [Phaeobacter italicus]